MEDDNFQALANRMKRRLRDVSSPDPEYCIYRVHDKLRRGHINDYTPRVVSIGPFHRGKVALKAMEDRKWCYLLAFLKRNPDLKFEDFLKAVQGLEGKTRRCYGEPICLSSENFNEMMVVDGCFIIELFLQFQIEGIPRCGDDPIFNEVELLRRIRLDLILLENQLPFFLLLCLFNITAAFNGDPSLVELALCFFRDIVPGHKKLTAADGPDIRHLLDLLRHSYAPSRIETQPHDDSPRVLMCGAKKLGKEAAVKFKKGKAGSLLDIKFHLNGAMEIPPLQVQEETQPLFRNFIAFEQCCGASNTYITYYISFMASLINSRDDEYLLCDAGIIENHLPGGFASEVSDLFNCVSKQVILPKSHYSKLFTKVKAHCASPWRVWLAAFLHDLGLVIASIPVIVIIYLVIRPSVGF